MSSPSTCLPRVGDLSHLSTFACHCFPARFCSLSPLRSAWPPCEVSWPLRGVWFPFGDLKGIAQFGTFCGASLTRSPFEGSLCWVFSVGFLVRGHLCKVFHQGPCCGVSEGGSVYGVSPWGPLSRVSQSRILSVEIWSLLSPTFPLPVILCPVDAL